MFGQARETLNCWHRRGRYSNDVERWLPARSARALKAHGIKTLADLTVRIPRRRRWWAVIPDLGATSAKQIEAFFAAHAELTACRWP